MHAWVVEEKRKGSDWFEIAVFLTRKEAREEANMERSWVPFCRDPSKYRIRKYVPERAS